MTAAACESVNGITLSLAPRNQPQERYYSAEPVPKMNRPTLLAVRMLAILLIAVGVIWILQGINLLPSSFIAGQIQWAYRGGLRPLWACCFCCSGCEDADESTSDVPLPPACSRLNRRTAPRVL
jgi:hypothetical protein